MGGGQREHAFGHLGVQRGEAADLVHHERHQQEGHDDDEDALDEVGEHRGRQAPGHAVGDEEHGHQSDGEPHGQGTVGDRLDGAARALQHQGHGDHHEEHAGEAVEDSQPPAEAFLEIVGGGNVAHAPEDERGYPVEGGDEEPEPLIPDAGQADLVRSSGHRDRLVGVGAGAEVVHDHQPAAELASAHEVVAGAVHLPGRPQADAGDAQEIEDQGE